MAAATKKYMYVSVEFYNEVTVCLEGEGNVVLQMLLIGCCIVWLLLCSSAGVEYYDQHFCGTSVCLQADLRNHMSKPRQIFCTCCLWIGPFPVAMQ